MIFANKQDIEGAMTVSEVSNALGLHALKNWKHQILKTSAINGVGLEEGMEWCVSYFTFSYPSMDRMVLRNWIFTSGFSLWLTTLLCSQPSYSFKNCYASSTATQQNG